MIPRTLLARAASSVGFATMLLATGPATAKTQTPPPTYGPVPDWTEFRRLAEAAITARLLDPESARFTWLSGFAPAYMRPELFQPKVAGYWACGKVNARNKMGGYSGGGTFMVVIDYGRVLATSLDEGMNGANGIACQSLIERGMVPPVPAGTPVGVAMTTTPASTPAAAAAADGTTATGMTLHVMPEGAYITQVAPGTVAAAAGLKPGMVIASVNAVPLATMGDSMTKVVDAAGASANLGLVGGTTIKLGEHR